jgi:FkbM family methyltransferase
MEPKGMHIRYISPLIQFFDVIGHHGLAQSRKLFVIRRRLYWFLIARFSRYPIVYPFIDGTVIILAKGMTGSSNNFYLGLKDFGEMSFLLHFLREGDVFGDIGANVGIYAILASGVCKARSIAMEPAAETLPSLHRHILINDLKDKIEVVPCGAGAARGELRFSVGEGEKNHFISGDKGVPTQVLPLDEVFEGRPPALLKIDVEGLEEGVIAGAASLMASPVLQAIIIEWPGQALNDRLLALGFRTVLYDPRSRRLDPRSYEGLQNVIYVKDMDFVLGRLTSAAKFEVFGEMI